MTPAVRHGAVVQIHQAEVAGWGRMGRLCAYARCQFGPTTSEKFIGGWLAGMDKTAL